MNNKAINNTLLIFVIIFFALFLILVLPLLSMAKETDEDCMCPCSCEDAGEDYDYSDKIIISEIYPAPNTDEEEFIELKNTGSKKVDLNGWKLSDASSKIFTIDKEDFSSTQIDDYFLITGDISKIFLNNGGDSVELFDPDEKSMQVVEYDSADTGTAYAFLDGEWSWTLLPTPNEPNEIEVVDEEDEEGTEEDGGDGEDGEDEEGLGLLSISEVRQLEKGENVKVQGVVTVDPGILGTQVFYIQDEEAGIQIYCSKKDFPDGLKIGDLIEVNGEVSESRNEKKINYSTAEDVEIIGSESVSSRSVEELGEEVEGMLVGVEGPILEKSSTKLYLDNDLIIYKKSTTDVSFSDFEEGDVISAIGIVNQYDEEYRMMPRSKDDIETQSSATEDDESGGGLIKAAQAAGPSGGISESIINKIPQPNKYFYYIAGSILALLVVLVIAGWKLGWHKKIKIAYDAMKKALQEA